MVENPRIENLLKQVQSKITYSKKLSELNGENFNIFSLLQIETSENNTHSRFLAELLNPKGSHRLKNIMLSAFLELIVKPLCDVDNLVTKNLNIQSAKIIVEKNIGKIDNDSKTGGRIDIVVTDGKYSILIENKIYAVDQKYQIERYCNYYKTESLVLYLSLFGNEPNQSSRGKLESGKDFYCISYQDDITRWLEQCYKEAADKPILRETIKQYLILIKKLTGQLTNHKMTEEVRNLILKDLESAKIIAENFHAAKNDLLERIRNSIKKNLEASEYISSYYIIKTADSKAGDKNSKLWFRHKQVKDGTGIFFGIEPFSGWGHYGPDMFIGIIDLDSTHLNLFEKDISDLKILGWWRGVENLQFENSNIILSSMHTLQSLSDKEKLNKLIDSIVRQTISYINRYENTYLRICRKAELK